MTVNTRVLIVAGSDSGGGAGIQADIKTVTMLGGYAATAVTAITVQNTLGVSAIVPIAPDVVAAQMRAVLDDIGADIVKIGMLGDAAVIATVAEVLRDARLPVVLDPVMVAKGGAALLEDDAVEAMLRLLVPLATVVTPNTPELAALAGSDIEDEGDVVLAAQELLDLGAGAVLAKGAHMDGAEIADWLVTPSLQTRFVSARIDTVHTHGTGCTLASALATLLGQGVALPEAVERARDYVQAAIRAAPGFGAGHGPLGHNWALAR
ncbi:bifunctional hydroxymethylpyrimidine kinase/phosphomethylpyrimidine kinase [Polymorphobacter arshaanensis]|uniref:hydroxymethylpyrimidine kinase n=1 Tax=Glacieibacterium arshaanense TaxID=2511025 RepID=A0A4Y9EQZ3_9SPHN|nr:bifunctional hydroxymethylpyrimidine kinase/phosphomethylpyrimidine kinase [Polymorphobacter arshaanensis]TFU06036.1 bifunctional hydroxymethylpyrimidine kinase/phosphomethylpyrimidine kinase [Polymorphobacter arshaanensis]